MSDLARELWDARRLGYTISPERDDLPTTLVEAFELQDQIIEMSGLPTCGYKVGSTSKEAQRVLNVNEPGVSALLEPYVKQSPANQEIVLDQIPAVEGEFAFRLGGDLPARRAPYAMADVVAAIDQVAGAIEIVGTRFSGGLRGKGRLLTTGDCGVNIALVVGDWSDFTNRDWAAHEVNLSVNGKLTGKGRGREALGGPLNVMLWLANHLSGRGRGFKAGDIVATGTCTGLDPVQPGDLVAADFGELGQVSISLDGQS